MGRRASSSSVGFFVALLEVKTGMTAAAALIALAISVQCALLVRNFRGTTFAAPVVWAAVGAAALAVVEGFLLWRGDAVGSLARTTLRMFAATGTFAAPMAVLGAKRPQDRGWQWIVATLWVVAALPAVQAALAPAGDRLEIAGLWAGFLAAVAAYSTVLNYGPTRYAAASALYLLGQATLLAPATRWRPALPRFDEAAAVTGVALLLAALAFARRTASHIPAAERFAATANAHSLTPDARWRGFRDAFGLSWGLRILQRVNETAQLADWPVRLAWSGFVPAADENQPKAAAPFASSRAETIHAALDTLLRRFEPVDRAPLPPAS